MPVTIGGDGTITGVSVGGLPDGIVDADMLASSAVTTAKINDSAVTTAKINDDAVTDAKQSLSGVAKAWVNFNGTGTVAIRDSFNVSSITDNGTGDYTVTFTNAMSDTNYAVAGSAKRPATGSADMFLAVKQSISYDSHSTTSIKVMARFDNSQAGDSDAVSVVIFGA